MYTAFVLVKNLTSNSNELNFSEFKLTKIRYGDVDALKKAQAVFSVGIPLYDDWIYERHYNNVKAHPLEIIPIDVEDILFLLRLFKLGDLVFVKHCVREEDGNMLRQLPYRVMSDIHPFCEYELRQAECSTFDEFASEIMSQKNWGETWFKTARRFFLYGSSKEFNPKIKEVDRIVDYMIALESILVPEKDFVGRRLRERAVSLMNSINHNDTNRLLNYFYDIRSTIVHGGDISSVKNGILDKYIEFESIVRKVIIEAVNALPEDEANRKAFLKQLFDVCDGDRATKVHQDFCAIKDTNETKRCFDLISKRLTKTKNRIQRTENK